jgi:hypothetical protein
VSAFGLPNVARWKNGIADDLSALSHLVVEITLRVILAICAVVAVFALLVARTAWSEGGTVAHLQWPSLVVAGTAVSVMLVTLANRSIRKQ